jgi:excisionase family DNA binding protein
MITPDTSSELLTVAEAAQALRISKPTIWRWIREGRLHPVRLGRRVVRLRRSEVGAIERSADRTAGEPWWSKYVVSVGDPSADPEEVMARLNALNEAILARRGGVPFESSLPLIHEGRSARDEQL